MRRFLYWSHLYGILVVISSVGAGFRQVVVPNLGRRRGLADQKEKSGKAGSHLRLPRPDAYSYASLEQRKHNYLNANPFQSSFGEGPRHRAHLFKSFDRASTPSGCAVVRRPL